MSWGDQLPAGLGLGCGLVRGGVAGCSPHRLLTWHATPCDVLTDNLCRSSYEACAMRSKAACCAPDWCPCAMHPFGGGGLGLRRRPRQAAHGAAAPSPFTCTMNATFSTGWPWASRNNTTSSCRVSCSSSGCTCIPRMDATHGEQSGG